MTIRGGTMPDQGTRIDLRLGDFAVSLQGFENPVPPLKQTLRFVQRLIEETPEIAGTSLALEEEDIEALLDTVSGRLDLPRDHLSVTPGLVIVATPEVSEADRPVEIEADPDLSVATAATAADALAPSIPAAEDQEAPAAATVSEEQEGPDSTQGVEDAGPTDPGVGRASVIETPEASGATATDDAVSTTELAQPADAPPAGDVEPAEGDLPSAAEAPPVITVAPVSEPTTEAPTLEPDALPVEAEFTEEELASAAVVPPVEEAIEPEPANIFAADPEPSNIFAAEPEPEAVPDPDPGAASSEQAEEPASVEPADIPPHAAPGVMPSEEPEYEPTAACDEVPDVDLAPANIFASDPDPDPAPSTIFASEPTPPAAPPEPVPAVASAGPLPTRRDEAPEPVAANIFAPDPAPDPEPANIFAGGSEQAASPDPATAEGSLGAPSLRPDLPVPSVPANIFAAENDDPVPSPIGIDPADPIGDPEGAQGSGRRLFGPSGRAPDGPPWIDDPNEPAPVGTSEMHVPPAAPAEEDEGPRLEDIMSRVRGGDPSEHVAGEADPASPAPGARAASAIDAAELANRSEASSVPELLSAAAAWLTLVDKRSTFGRREVMDVFDTIPGEHPRTLEARIKGYGKLVRSGALVLVDDGRFALSQEERDRYRAYL